MYVEASSNGFIVDDTPPSFTTNLTMSPIGTIIKGTTVSRTTLRVYWDVKDKESFIESQHLSISSHIGGDFNLSSTKVLKIKTVTYVLYFEIIILLDNKNTVT